MKAIQVRTFGAPNVLDVVDLPIPNPKAAQVCIEIRAIGVNPVDAICRSGAAPWVTLPFVPGFDAAGVVVETKSERWAAGDRVYFTLTPNCYAEYVCCDADAVFPLPASVSFETGAALGIPYYTAYGALFQRARLSRGEILLVRGASGAVGAAAVQWAVARGHRVIGTAGSQAGIEWVRSNGAALALDHRAPLLEAVLAETGGRGVDVVLELHSASLNDDLDLVAPHGRVVVIGDRDPVRIDPLKLTSRYASLLGFNVAGSLTAADLACINTAVLAGLADGTLRPNVTRQFPLSEAAAAHEMLGRSGLNGKIVLIP